MDSTVIDFRETSAIAGRRQPVCQQVLSLDQFSRADYRALNNISRKNRYPLPLINETLQRIGKATRFTKFRWWRIGADAAVL